jgi:hypothetical protein
MNPLTKIGFETSPTLLLKKYRRAINHEASVTGTAISRGGLKDFGITMTDTEFAAYLLTNPYPPVPALAANATQATIDAAAALAAEVALPSYRPVPQPPVLPGDQGSEAQFRRYTAKQANYVIFANGLQDLKKMITDSLGDSIIAAMETEAVPVENMSIPQILQYLVNTYGVTTKTDVQTLIDRCSNPCENMADFYAHAQRLANLYQQLERKEAAIAKYQQMKYLEDTTKHIDVIDEARINYIIANPTYATQSFADMVTFIREQLQNKVPTVRSLGIGSSVTGKQPSTKVVVASMDTVTDLLLSVVDRLDRAEKALAISKQKAAPTSNAPNQGSGRVKGNLYCFCHGFNNSHVGVDCKVMMSDVSYTAAHKAAQAPALIDGKQGRN